MEQKDKILLASGIGLIGITAIMAFLNRDTLLTATRQELLEQLNKIGMKKSFFTIAELCKSDTAKAKGIDNTPSPIVEQNLQALIDNILNPVRTLFGKAIHVSSGYRCAKLNQVIGGVPNSQHQTGQAVDIYPTNSADFPLLFSLLYRLGNFDQLIWECVGNSRWIHVSYTNGSGRKQVMSYIKGKYENINSNWQDVVKMA